MSEDDEYDEDEEEWESEDDDPNARQYREYVDDMERQYQKYVDDSYRDYHRSARARPIHAMPFKTSTMFMMSTIMHYNASRLKTS